MRGHIIGKLVNAHQGMKYMNSIELTGHRFRYLRTNWVSRLPGDIGMDANGAYIPRKPLGWSEAYAEEEPSWAGSGPTGVEIPSTQARDSEPQKSKAAETKYQPTETKL